VNVILKVALMTFLLSLVMTMTVLSAAELSLSVNGRTQYAIVKPDPCSSVDDHAVQTLSGYLRQMTGAEFDVVTAAEAGLDRPRIWVGMSDAARKALGNDPLAKLEEEQHVCRTVGDDIFLYGKGVHGNLWAVMNFLEDTLGWRWYSVHEKPVVPEKPTVRLQPFSRTCSFSIKYRQVSLNFGADFSYQNRANMGYALKRGRPPYVARMSSTMFVHSTTSYIPPLPTDRHADRFPWQDKKNYFETDPDFFTMNEFGERVPNRQLCFGNPALRKELTRNVYRDIAHGRKLPGDGLIVTVDAADVGGWFCCCDACKALEEKYQSPGGPMFDYVIELCGGLRHEHPDVMVRMLAYRRGQTQHPPVLPGGGTFPPNFIAVFAPIEDAYQADWVNHRDPKIQGTYRDLVGWGKITHHLWAWLYPNPWGTGMVMPIGNIERIVNNMRRMREAGVEGLFTDHEGINHRNSFHELQAYLILKLMQDVDRDVDAIVTEFTDYHYGAAGALMRTYIHELEQGRKTMAVPPGVTYRSKYFDDATFPYLTATNIHRWQGYFDRMEALTADQPEKLLHVRTVRRKLDFATLWKWLDLAKAYPEEFRDHGAVASRIRATNATVSSKHFVRPVAPNSVSDFAMKIRAGGRTPSLPQELTGVDPSRTRQYVPVSGRATSPSVEDADAAFGYAAPVHKPDMPFCFGFYQDDRATDDETALPVLPKNSRAAWVRAGSRKFTLQRRITAEGITAGRYRLYELGEVDVTPDCKIWFSAQSWRTHVSIGERLYEPGAGNRWKVYASIRFDGPAYGGKAKVDRVLVGRVILISLSRDQFAKP
jgi:hypothetical protein